MIRIEALTLRDKECRGGLETSVKITCDGEEKKKIVWKVSLICPEDYSQEKSRRRKGCKERRKRKE